MMEIRKTQVSDVEAVLKLYEDARTFMREQGNADQWPPYYPGLADVELDMEQDRAYVCVEGNEILASFSYACADEPCYAHIEEGRWQDDEPYGVLHRLAVKRGTNGIGSYCLDWAYNACGNLRVDTHEKNLPMRNLLKKLGFGYCGIIYVEDGSPRLAFQKKKALRF